MSDFDSYFYPGTEVLRNKLDIRDVEALEHIERGHVEQRLSEGCPSGNFDLDHLKAIHRHLFQDVYEWAGDLRVVAMSKERSVFMPPDRIDMGMRDVHRRLVESDFLQNIDPAAFSAKAAEIIGDINHVHPFREGNGRAQLQYLKQLAEQAGQNLDLTKLNGEKWIEASILANAANYEAMKNQIGEAMVPTLALEEIAQLRKSLNDRQEIERQKLLDIHEAERAAVSQSDQKAVKALAKQQASEALEQDQRHKDELARYMREREEARRLSERLEAQRRLHDLSLEKKSPERER
jgi:cell filamentation protein